MISRVSNNLSFNQQLSSLRHKANERDITLDDKLKAGFGAVIGTAIPMAVMMKKRKIKNPLNVDFCHLKVINDF